MQKNYNQTLDLESLDLGPIYSQGLVHYIYHVEDMIVKVPKKEFPDFNNSQHFKLEVACLNLVKSHGIPTPDSITVSEIVIDSIKSNCLIETFVNGKQSSWDKLNVKTIEEIVNVYNTCHKISIKGSGYLNERLEGTSRDWKDFIINSISDNRKHLLDNVKVDICNKVAKFLEDEMPLVSSNETFTNNVFLLVDFNPGNIFLDENGKIISVIDIDHPLGGDPLFDYAPINWHHEDTFRKIQATYIKLRGINLFSVYYYTLLYGLNTIVWRINHGLTNEEEFIKLNDFYEKAKISKKENISEQ